MSNDYIEDANEELKESTEPPRSLEEFVDHVLENPEHAVGAAQYIVNAIESYGTRTVVEEGEEKERYTFFDDPNGNGEHAVLGNTDILNEFVDDLRQRASGGVDTEKILWFDGPTATGKSELKRCLISGLKGYSKTPEGARYTLEWNANTRDNGSGMTYSGGAPEQSEDDWYESPVMVNPLTVFPSETRENLVSELNDRLNGGNISVTGDLDPFSREAYELLADHYARQNVDDIFKQVTDKNHLRVKRQTLSIGDGIGVLHSEDGGSPKERLVGSWMRGMLQELDSRGRKNPQAFSYDGVVSQGNGGATIVEDASQHGDLLQLLLNVPEEKMVKLDKEIGMDIDTVMFIISNPDLGAQLDQHSEQIGKDPLKALKRRLHKYRFRYLTGLTNEVELLQRELTDETERWSNEQGDEEERIGEPLTLYDGELSPHAVEAAGMYDVVSRLHKDDLPRGQTLVEKALIYDRGYHMTDGERTDKDEFEYNDQRLDGRRGIPVTYTRDVIADLAQSNDVVLPQDVLDAMVEHLPDEPVFSDGEVEEYASRVDSVHTYVLDKQEVDVLDAMLRDKEVSDDSLQEYVEHVYAWGTDETLSGDDLADVDDEPDPWKMKVFETEKLGRFGDENYDDAEPAPVVKDFRRDVINAVDNYVWENRTENFTIEDDLELSDLPVFADILGSHDWDDVDRLYENFDASQWDDPPQGTETDTLKQKTIQNMVDHHGYTEESAQRVAQIVVTTRCLNDSEPFGSQPDDDAWPQESDSGRDSWP